MEYGQKTAAQFIIELSMNSRVLRPQLKVPFVFP